jgi:hypothetical protein
MAGRIARVLRPRLSGLPSGSSSRVTRLPSQQSRRRVAGGSGATSAISHRPSAASSRSTCSSNVHGDQTCKLQWFDSREASGRWACRGIAHAVRLEARKAVEQGSAISSLADRSRDGVPLQIVGSPPRWREAWSRARSSGPTINDTDRAPVARDQRCACASQGVSRASAPEPPLLQPRRSPTMRPLTIRNWVQCENRNSPAGSKSSSASRPPRETRASSARTNVRRPASRAQHPSRASVWLR